MNNRGTLGALGALSIQADGIANQADSLLFSGADMTLRSAVLSNLYGDLYSQGNLSFAGADGGQATQLSNRSGRIEAQGDLSIDAASVENARDVFALSTQVTDAVVDVRCGQHCGGHDWFKRGKIDVSETVSETITQDSPSAWLVAGNDLSINAGEVENRYSVIAANHDLSIKADDLLNQGASTRTGTTTVVINNVSGDAGKVPTSDWDAMERGLAKPFNAARANGEFREDLYEQLWATWNQSPPWAVGTKVTTWTENGEALAPATLQAGNQVSLQVTRNLQNGTVSDYTRAQLTGELAGSLLGQSLEKVDLTLNKRAAAATTEVAQSVQRVDSVAADGSSQVSFVPVDYTGVPFAAVDPTASSTFRLPQGQYGLFIQSPDPQSHYLIESNPALTQLGQFLSSNYLLGKLGYSADASWKMLGDGAYETRLIREAVQAQTGQRFLDGLTSDYDQYLYLMNNALAAKDTLNLSVGVVLSSEQVAALTHDIVWMQDDVVDGQHVLVPVLYLAQTDARNLDGGSLIQGRDLSLMAGGDLVNVGTLRASNDLSASAGGSLLNGGLVDAGQRVTLLAQDSIRNALAGEIRGNQVDLSAIKGDIVNDRTAVTSSIGGGEYRTFLDAGSRISARDSLSLEAGQDITNRGALKAGGDASLSAGRDINLQAVTDASLVRDVQKGGHHVTTTNREENLAATLEAGGNLDLSAGRDLNLVGSQANAGKDLSAQAARDINLVAAQDQTDVGISSKHGKERVHQEQTSVRQQAAELSAGGDLQASAGQNLSLTASKITAGNEAYLVAGDKLELLAANDSDYSLYDMKKKGSFGAKKTQRDEVTDVRALGSQISTGGDLTLLSGGDQTYQVAQLDSGKDLAIVSGGAVTFEGEKDLHQESHEKSNSDMAWTSAKGRGQTDETLRQSQLLAQGKLTIQAVEGLHIDINHLDQQSVSQTIDTLVKADPGLAWLKDAEARGDVDWRRVKEIHDSWHYSHSGMGPATQLIVAIVAAAAGGIAAAGALTSAGVGGVTMGVGVGAAGSLAGTAGVSIINNKGNLGATLSDTFSSDSLKQAMVSAAVGGLTAGYFDKLSGSKTNFKIVNGAVVADLGSWSGIGSFAANQALQNTTAALLNQALGQGGSLGDALQNSLYNTFAAAGFNLVGDFGSSHNLQPGSASMIALHALMGGMVSAARGGDFATGAAAAGANEALVASLDGVFKQLSPDNRDALITMSAQVVGVLAVAATNPDASGKDLDTGAWVAKNSAQYNYLSHDQEEQKNSELDGCKEKVLCKTGVEARWAMTSAMQDAGIVVGVGGGIGLSAAETAEGLFQLVTHLPETMDAIRLLSTSPEFRQQFGDNYLQDLEQRADQLTNAYNEAGWQGSVSAGVEGGHFAVELVGVLTAIRGGAKIAAKLPTAAKNILNAVAEAPISGSKAAQIGAVGDIGQVPKGTSSVVDAEKAALERIAQNPKGVDLAGKQPNSVLQQQSQNRIDDLAVQYNAKSIEPKDFQLNLGGKVLKTDPQVSKGAPVYEGATTSDVMSYFKQLAGVENMPVAKVVPGKGTIYTATTEGGSKITLRDFSRSSQQTGASWTIDVMDKVINGGRTVEIKFK
ncbi:MAG: 16S rRNA endonuclease CdiA [Pseudomonas sp.]|nr:MAG: 16S rRNA endonuclease CdiA [Pseudomonas sp.]